MKAKIIGISDGLSWFSLNQEIKISIKNLENKIHQMIIDEKKYIIEITKTIFVNNSTIVIECFISDNIDSGKIGFELKY